MKYTEADILVKPKAFELFFKEKYRLFCAIALKYVHNLDNAEEIVQDTMVRLWEKREQIEIKGSLLAYLTTSIKNSCINYLKHQEIVIAHERLENRRLSYDPSEAEEEMRDIELETAVITAISELPPQRQRVFTLSRTEGLKYHEIAQKLGISVKTVEAQMGLALKQLRTKLKDYIE